MQEVEIVYQINAQAVLVHATEGICGCVVSFKPWPFYPTQKEPLVSTEKVTWWVLVPVLTFWNWTTPQSSSLQPASNRDIQFIIIIIINRLLHTKRQDEPGMTTEETSGCERPERVSKWPNSDDDDDDLLHFCDHSLIFRNWINEHTVYV